MKTLKYISILCLSWTSLFAQSYKEIGTLKVGCIFPLSGSMAPLGKEAQAAIQVALEDLKSNPRYRSTVPHIEVLFEDDKSHPQGAKDAANRLVKQHRVSVLFGSIGELNSRAIEKVGEEANIPVFLPTSFPREKTGSFTGRQSEAQTARALARYLHNTLKIKQVSFLAHSKSSAASSSFMKSYRIHGGKVMKDFTQYTSGEQLDKNRIAQLADLFAQENITALVTDSPLGDFKAVLDALGKKAPIVVSLSHRVIPADMGAYRILSAESFMNHDPHINEFTKRFYDLTRWKPQKASAMIYDGFLLIGSIFTRAQSPRPEALFQALSKPHSYEGLHGSTLLHNKTIQKTALILEHSPEGRKILHRSQPRPQHSL
ncbi:MAG: ABC transporter substrate-binding protein [Oligoflexales bacterium]